MRALAIHRFLLRLAFAAVHVFAWVFVFQYFYSLELSVATALIHTALFYTLSQAIACLVTPIAARFLRGGVRRLMFLGVLFAAAAFVVLGAALEGFWPLEYMGAAIAAFAVCMGFYRALYWIPYEVEISGETRKRPSVFWEILIAVSPLVAGLLIASAGEISGWVLYSGAGIVLLSLVPILSVRDIHERFSWGYRETFTKLFTIEHRHIATSSFLEGVSGAALLFFWPLAVFLIVESSYGMLGIILAFTFLMAILTRGAVRKALRRLGLARSRTLDVVFAASPWLFRIVVGTPFAIMLVDSYFYTTTPRRLGVDPLVFEQAADGGSYVDEYTALKEIALALGRTVISILGVTTALFMPIPAVFISIFVAAGLCTVAGVLWLRSN